MIKLLAYVVLVFGLAYATLTHSLPAAAVVVALFAVSSAFLEE